MAKLSDWGHPPALAGRQRWDGKWEKLVPTRILVVEDDESLRETLCLGLKRSGFLAEPAADGAAAIEQFRRGSFDLVLLDLMLPEVDGYQVCKQISSISSTPIVILTARDAPSNAITGLELGAVDYVRKPFDMGELVARIRAALRRAAEPSPSLVIGDLHISLEEHLVRKDDRVIDLTPMEFRLLADLAERAGQAITREALLRRVWDLDGIGQPHVVNTTIKRLRDKLGPNGGRILVSVRGVGYKLVPAPGDDS